jgi:hypothetical protein
LELLFMLDKNSLALMLHRRETFDVQAVQTKPAKHFHGEKLLIICSLVAISSYFMLSLVRQIDRLADYNSVNARSISLLSQRIQQQSTALESLSKADNQVMQSLQETNQRNGRIEHRLTRIEDDHMALKRANATILANEDGLRQQVAQLTARAQVDHSTAAPIPIPNPAIPSAPPSLPVPNSAGHQHEFSNGLTPPPGTVVMRSANEEEIWILPKDGQSQQVRPIGKTGLGVVVHNLLDGKDYIVTPSGGWLGSSVR